MLARRVGEVTGLAGQQMQDHLGLFILGLLVKSWQDLGHHRCNHKWRDKNRSQGYANRAIPRAKLDRCPLYGDLLSLNSVHPLRSALGTSRNRRLSHARARNCGARSRDPIPVWIKWVGVGAAQAWVRRCVARCAVSRSSSTSRRRRPWL